MQYERRWLAVVALGLSLFLSALDGTIVALALPTIARHFQLSDPSDLAHPPSGRPGGSLPHASYLPDLGGGLRPGQSHLRPGIEFRAAAGGPRSAGVLWSSDCHARHRGGRSRRLASRARAGHGSHRCARPSRRGRRPRHWRPAPGEFWLVLHLLRECAYLPAGSPAGALQLTWCAPGRETVWQCLSSDGGIVAPSAVPVGTAGIFLQCDGRWCPLLPLTV